MRIEELRIGNLLQDKVSKTELKVIELTEKDIVTYVVDRSMFPLKDGWGIEPIPIIEEHLKEFGLTFSSEWHGKDFYLHQTFSIDDEFLGVEYFEIGLNINDDNSIHSFFHENSTMEYKYLHELQNLHFALHGRDLVRKK